jgi:hydroxylamine reductase (hybrid-cluster protein)
MHHLQLGTFARRFRTTAETDNGTGCSASVGVCGKTPEVSAMQDLFIHQLQGISQYANEARKRGSRDSGIEDFVLEGEKDLLIAAVSLLHHRGKRDKARAFTLQRRGDVCVHRFGR